MNAVCMVTRSCHGTCTLLSIHDMYWQPVSREHLHNTLPAEVDEGGNQRLLISGRIPDGRVTAAMPFHAGCMSGVAHIMFDL